jgi:hypothetical protein
MVAGAFVDAATRLLFDLVSEGPGRATLLATILVFALNVISLLICSASLVFVSHGPRRGASLLRPALNWFGLAWILLMAGIGWWLNLWRDFDLWTLRFLTALWLPGIVSLIAGAILHRYGS